MLNVNIKKIFPGISVSCSFEQALQGASSTALFGPSGCGKTTVLRSIAGLERPESGCISWDGETWFDASSKTFIPPQLRRAGLLFQDYALFPFMSVIENVSYGMPSASRKDAVKLLERLMAPGLERRMPHELSGGQQQRVALARAIVRKPRLLLLDEPLSALDMPTRTALRGELRRTLRAEGIPSVIVTHDPVEAMSLSDRIVVMSDGRTLQKGTVAEVFNHPSSVEVARIIGAETLVSGMAEGESDGLLCIRVGAARLYAPMPPGGASGQVNVCIRADNVAMLPSSGEASCSSARNRLPGRITDISEEGSLVRIGIDCGFPLAALVTRQSAAELGLKEGAEATAIVKAASIHLLGK